MLAVNFSSLRNNAVLWAFIIFGLFLFFGLFRSGTAHAETNTAISASAPTPGSGTTSGGTSFTPLTGVGRGSFDGRVMWYKIYVPIGQSTTIDVNQTCADSFGNPTVDYNIDTLGTTEQDYQGPFGIIYTSPVKTSSTCSQKVSFTIPANAGIASSFIGHEGYRTFGFYAEMEQGPGSAEQYFTVTSSVANSFVGLSKPDVTNPSLGGKPLKYSTIYKTSGTWSASVMFATRCDQNFNNQAENIQIYDPDNGIYQNNMTASLERSPSPGTINWSTQKTWNATTVQGGAWATSGTTGTLDFTVSSPYIYKFHVLDSSHPNTIQIKLPFDQFDARQTVRQACNNTSDGATCTIATSPATLNTKVAPNISIAVTITATNTGSSTWDNTYYMKRVGPSVVNLQNVSGSVYPKPSGKTPYTFKFTDTVSAPGPNGTKTITYRMYNASGPFGTSCSRVINTTGSGGGSNGTFTFDCDYTRAYNMKTTAYYYVYKTTTTQPAPYLTTVPPSQWGAWPYPPGPPQATPFQILNMTTYTYTPPPQTTTYLDTTDPKPATLIPYDIHFVGSDGFQTDVTGTMPLSGMTWDTFNTWAFLWPHNAYSATMYAQVSGYLGDNQNGPYDYTQTLIGTDNIDQCLSITPANGGTTACLGAPAADLEPGDTNTFNYQIGTFTNKTLKTFNTSDLNGYNFQVTTNGGFVYSGPNPPGTSGIPPGNTNMTVNVPITANWEGGFTLYFRFRGTVLDASYWNGEWDGICSHNPGCPDTGPCDIVATHPYYKIYNGDVSAGGAFADANGNCSVNTSAEQNGTVLAYSYPTGANGGPRGASSDFGAIALGLIQGNTGGIYGFFDSAKNNNGFNNLSFANTGSGLNSALNGGYMAGQNASVGSDHCVTDYFDNAAKATNPTYSAGGDVAINQLKSNGTDANNIPGQYYYGGDINLTSPPNFGFKDRVTLFVKGDVYISDDIAYDENWDPTNLNGNNGAPYLTVIAEGNIIVDPGVTRVDGLYVAQGDGSSSGIFATCGTPGTPASADEMGADCTQKLTLNGAVIAQVIKPLRVPGSLKYSSVNEPMTSGNLAESFNFIPSMVLADPNFAQLLGTGAVTPGTIEGLTSLPPVF